MNNQSRANKLNLHLPSSTLSSLQPNPSAIEPYKWSEMYEWGPEKILRVYDPDTGMKGVLVIDLGDHRLTKMDLIEWSVFLTNSVFVFDIHNY